MSWSIEGTYFETCSCELMCPGNLFVDDGASDEQMQKLTGVFGGQMGGPMAGLAPLIGEMRGVERAPIEVVEDGRLHTVRIGDAIDFEIEDVVPFGVEKGEPVEFEGKTGRSSAFSWAA